MTKMLPVGIDDFEKLRHEDFYYVDKTDLIEDLIHHRAEVNLFTRPRRFGKTLNMSMLQHFFEVGSDRSLFDGLRISHDKALCEAYMGQYPVIFVSLKDVEGLAFRDALYCLKELIGREAERFSFLLESDRLSDNEKDRYRAITALEKGKYAMDEDVLSSSLQVLSELLSLHYGRKTIILIDEYDVPLDKAFANGYYREMVALIRGFLRRALKTNRFLEFAVLTGCLHISKESIFTGLNNFDVNSIADAAHDEHFGFTKDDVQKLLRDYEFEEKADTIKRWYDGYHFGSADIYCPWDVINYVKKLRMDMNALPEAFWINTSGNHLVKRFVDKADKSTRDEIERLIAGESIEKDIRMELTYDEIDNSIDNLWSVLYTTGYLTLAKDTRVENKSGFEDDQHAASRLVIPNREVREVFVAQIQEWFKETMRRDDSPVGALCKALLGGAEDQVQRQLNLILGKSISILDSKARAGKHESFYHGLLIGLLRSESEWLIRSNTEAGDGFSDIIVEPEDPDTGIVIEVKYAASFAGLEAACETALSQIKTRRYGEYLRNDGRVDILAYGIAFNKKRCRVAVERL